MDCVKVICNKYNLNKKEVVDMLIENGVKLKSTIKHFPWDGKVKEGCCEGIKYCGGLFIQCKNKKTDESENYCSFCYKQSEQNEHGKPSAGNIKDRQAVPAMKYVDPKGRKVLPFATYMKKKKIDREFVEIEAKMKNIEIDEEQFIQVVVRRGRPKKNVDAVVNIENGMNDIVLGNVDPVSNDDNIVLRNDEEHNDDEDNHNEDNHNEDNDDDDEHNDEDENNDDDEIEVVEFEEDGNTYFKAENGKVYNNDSEEIGYWNDENKCIVFNKI
tara:strand:- start:911 stop:1723 length:813 start_codon:yes stop_codon:yes gene_type:complete